MRGKGRDTVGAAKAENNRDAKGGAKQTARRKQDTQADRTTRRMVRNEPHVYPPVQDEGA